MALGLGFRDVDGAVMKSTQQQCCVLWHDYTAQAAGALNALSS